MGGGADIVVVSNRGPVSFQPGDGGGLVGARGGGGLVNTLGPGVERSGATWVAAALTEHDRQAAAEGVAEAAGFRLRLLVTDPDDHRAYYDGISNAVLWYLYHGMFDTPRRPRFDRSFRQAWDAYRRVNQAFAEAAAREAGEGAVVLVQDYHLSLVGSMLAKERPDLRTVHFSHVPYCGPDTFRILPDDVGHELLSGLAAHGAVGFHCQRWATAFERCCDDVLGLVPSTFVAPAAPDADDIRRVALSPACEEAFRQLDGEVGDRLFLVRVDRTELSKNLLRGFAAFAELLETQPEWRERVVFGAFVYPSRQGLADYQAYAAEVETVVGQLNRRWSTPDWTPVLFDPHDDFPRSVAGLRRADAVVVNPIRDGLNLVAKEAMIVGERDPALVLSRESGVWDELGEWAFGCNPFDVTGTAEALHAALSAGLAERGERAAALRAAATRRTPLDWFDAQVAAAPS